MAAKDAEVKRTMEEWKELSPAQVADDLAKRISVEKGHALLLSLIRNGVIDLQAVDGTIEDEAKLRKTIYGLTNGRVKIDEVTDEISTEGISATQKAS